MAAIGEMLQVNSTLCTLNISGQRRTNSYKDNKTIMRLLFLANDILEAKALSEGIKANSTLASLNLKGQG